ncbi:MAG: DUF6114 domain-containing protein [Haloarculaceae archaeon]
MRRRLPSLDPRAAIQRFGEWRATRPFWGGVLLILGGVLMAAVPLQMSSSLLLGSYVSTIGLLFAALVLLAGVFALYRPELADLLGIAGAVFSLLSLFGALGGLFVGMFLGFAGGAYCFAWIPPDEREAYLAARAADGDDGDGEEDAAEDDGEGTASLTGKTAGLAIVAALLVLAVLAFTLAAPPANGFILGWGSTSQGYRFPNQTQNGGFVMSTSSLASGFLATWHRYQACPDTSNNQSLCMAEFVVNDDLEIHNVTISKNITYNSPNANYQYPADGSVVMKIGGGTMTGNPSLKINHSELYFDYFASANSLTLCTLGLSYHHVWSLSPYSWYPVSAGCNFEATNVTMLAHSMSVTDLNGKNFTLFAKDGGFHSIRYNKSTCSDGGAFNPGCSD